MVVARLAQGSMLTSYKSETQGMRPFEEICGTAWLAPKGPKLRDANDSFTLGPGRLLKKAASRMSPFSWRTRARRSNRLHSCSPLWD